MTVALLFLGVFASIPARCRAQTIDLDRGRQVDVSLSGSWRFHTGDDPSWSSPLLDDSSWSLIHANESWTRQGYTAYDGTAWYRARLLVPANSTPLSLYVPANAGSYQVFADGRLLATKGGLYATTPHQRLVLLPQRTTPDAYALSLAIRVWDCSAQQADQGSGIVSDALGDIRVGSSAIIQTEARLAESAKAVDSVSAIFLALLETLAGLTALTLFLFRRDEHEYFWFAVALLLSATGREVLLYSRSHEMRLLAVTSTVAILCQASNAARIFFYARLLEAKRSWAYWASVASTYALPCGRALQAGRIPRLLHRARSMF